MAFVFCRVLPVHPSLSGSSRLSFPCSCLCRHVSSSPRSRNYYDVLEINPKASPADVKAAYYKLSKQYHPDLNQSPNASVKFREISEAYETLGNVRARQSYDTDLQYGNRPRPAQSSYPRAPPRQNRYYEQGQTGFDERYEAFRARTAGGTKKPPPTGKNEWYDFDEFYRQHYQDVRQQQHNDKQWHNMSEQMQREAFRSTAARVNRITSSWMLFWFFSFMFLHLLFTSMDEATDPEHMRRQRQHHTHWEQNPYQNRERVVFWNDHFKSRVRDAYPTILPPPISSPPAASPSETVPAPVK